MAVTYEKAVYFNGNIFQECPKWKKFLLKLFITLCWGTERNTQSLLYRSTFIKFFMSSLKIVGYNLLLPFKWITPYPFYSKIFYSNFQEDGHHNSSQVLIKPSKKITMFCIYNFLQHTELTTFRRWFIF